jgi:predicted signal transduction protein with EAL and GGDEF domain
MQVVARSATLAKESGPSGRYVAATLFRANQRRFNSVLRTELSRGRRLGHPVSLIIADLDHFKTINDPCGHCGRDSRPSTCRDSRNRWRSSAAS